MENTLKKNNTECVKNAMDLIIHEHLELIKSLQYHEIAALIPTITSAKNIFVTGSGRTGLMMKALAMRLMHLGYKVHVVGETTAPAIRKGDVLIAGSGSGTTGGIVSAAETANTEGASVVCFTTNKESLLALLSKHTVIIPAAQKQKRNEDVSKQYAGSLFEQSLLLVTDALIKALWEQDGSLASELWKRHANME